MLSALTPAHVNYNCNPGLLARLTRVTSLGARPVKYSMLREAYIQEVMSLRNTADLLVK